MNLLVNLLSDMLQSIFISIDLKYTISRDKTCEGVNEKVRYLFG